MHTEWLSCKHKGRDQDDASTSQGTPKLSANHQKLWEGHGEESLPQPLEETNPAYDTLILDFDFLKLWYTTVLLFKLLSSGYFAIEALEN